MINLTIQNTIQSTIKNTLGNLSEKFITQLFVPVGSDSFITADNKIFKVRVDMSTLLYLFAEDQRGVWYDPSDLATLYQESGGTAPVTADGQPVGLMLDKSRGELLGDELVTNGTFDTDVSGWDGDVTWEAGRLKLPVAAAFIASGQDIPVEIGKKYIIEWEQFGSQVSGIVIYGSGSLEPQTGAGYYYPSVEGKFSVICTALSNTLLLHVVGYRTDVNDAFFDNVSVKEVIGIPAQQPISTQRPTYNATPDRLTLDLVDDSLAFTVPTGGIDGYMVVGTDEGTASYGVSLPAGDYDIGGDYFMGGSVNGFLLREGDVSASDLRNVEKDFVSKGAKASYGDVTYFTNYWRQKNITKFPLIDTSSGIDFALAWYDNNLTSFPLIDTSNVTNFSYAWRENNLTSFPLLDTSSATTFLSTWQNNPNLTNITENMFDNCNATTFTNAFLNTNLSQSSIDGILVSIESNGTSSGRFDQSGGSAPSATGEAAIDAMRSRGWTITVTGGY